ncbi:uncharacterized protein LOC105844293 [Hydra vulgaris]|uniref:uncharacterized protein LOC105844293 n=1 Tax=Hydra vulgaris TaxID=6087 RepID=UPI00064176D5|nr:glycine-rich RNA-binding protein 2 [Hydra vulgaris]
MVHLSVFVLLIIFFQLGKAAQNNDFKDKFVADIIDKANDNEDESSYEFDKNQMNDYGGGYGGKYGRDYSGGYGGGYGYGKRETNNVDDPRGGGGGGGGGSRSRSGGGGGGGGGGSRSRGGSRSGGGGGGGGGGGSRGRGK